MDIKLFIALRYLIAKKNKNIVNIITMIAISAIVITTASTFVILSTFSGLEEYNLTFQNSLSPEIEITSKIGKKLINIQALESVIKKEKEISIISKTITEKVYVSCEDKNEILNLKAIDTNFNAIYRLDSLVTFGSYFDFYSSSNSLLGVAAANNLSVFSDTLKKIKLIIPKPGIGIVSEKEELFNESELYVTGVVGNNNLYDNFVITPLEIGQKLLNLKSNEAYSLEIKLIPNQSAEEFKKKLSGIISNKLYVIKTRIDQNEAFVKVMNTEKLIIYFIFTLILFITIFNLSGSIIILILDKKDHIFILSSMGLAAVEIRKIFFYIGLAITFIGSTIGLILGSIIAFIQAEFGLVIANAYTPFPIKFLGENYLNIFLIVFFLGSITSYLVCKIVFTRNLKSIDSN